MTKRIEWKLPDHVKELAGGQEVIFLGRMDPSDQDAIDKAKARALKRLQKKALSGAIGPMQGTRNPQQKTDGFITPEVQREALRGQEADFRALAKTRSSERYDQLRDEMLNPSLPPQLTVEGMRQPVPEESTQDIYQIPGREGKFRSKKSDEYLLEIGQQPIAFDSFEEARKAHQQAFAMMQTLDVGPPSEIRPVLDPKYATPEEVKGEQELKAEDIQKRSTSGQLTTEDILYYYDNPQTFSDLGLSVEVPEWLKGYAQEQALLEKRNARGIAKDVSEAYASVLAGVDPDTKQRGIHKLIDKSDKELSSLSRGVAKQLGYSEAVQDAAEEGVLNVRKKRQESFRDAATRRSDIAELRGQEREEAIDGLSKKLTRVTVPNFSPPGIGGGKEANQAYVEDRLRAVRIDGEPLFEETIQRAMEDYRWLQDSGSITPTGNLSSPEKFWSSLWNRIGGSSGDQTATPVGDLISNNFQTSVGAERTAADEWKKRVSTRASNVDAQDGQWAKDVEVLYNAALGMHDMYQGLYALIDPSSDSQRIAQLTEAYRKYLVDNRGGRPVFGGEIAQLGREQNLEAAGAAIQGMKESLKKMIDQPIESLKGDPFGTVANAIMIARLANVTGLAGKYKPAIGQFLAKADNLMTGIPQALFVGKTVFGPLARKAGLIFKSPSRVELIVKRANQKSSELGAEAKASMESLQSKVESGKSFDEAVKETIGEASNEGGEFLSGVFLENHGMFSGATNVNDFIGGLTNKKAILTAVLDNDVNSLVKELPDEVLEQAGIKGAFSPEQLKPTSAEGFESILVDSTIIHKKIDDHLSQLKETGRDAERVALLQEVGRLQDQLKKGDGQLTEPLLRPDSELDINSTGPVPGVFDQNPGISNQALLIAAVNEARGKPIRVTVNTANKTFFEGPLVGPKEIIDAIPVGYRTRLPIYQRRQGSRAPELVEEMVEQGNTSDLALYLKRAKNQNRSPEAQKSFDRLEKHFEEATGVSVADLYERTRLGGLTQNADTVMELVVRRSSKVPGAPEGMPGLYGIPRSKQYVGGQGKPLKSDLPSDTPYQVEPYLTERQALSTKAPVKDRVALEKMEQERIAAADELRKNGMDPEQVMADYNKAVKESQSAFFTMPDELAGGAPRYGRFKIDWEGRDLERAIYIAGSKQASKAKSTYREALQSKGFTDAQIKTFRDEILQRLKKEAEGKKDGTLSAPFIKVPEDLIKASTPKALTQEGAEAISRSVNGEPMFTVGQQEALASQLTRRSTKNSLEKIGEAIDDREALIQTAMDQIMAKRMKQELQVNDDIANGRSFWDERTTPLIFTGTVDDVSSKLNDAGRQGSLYLNSMELQPVSDISRRAMRLGDEGDYVVPAFLNDAFNLQSKMRGIRSNISGYLSEGTAPGVIVGAIGSATSYVGSLFKRIVTSRNPLTFAFNNVSNMFLRAFTDGTVGPGLGVVLKDARDFRKGADIGPQKQAIMEAAEESGILSANVVVDDINPNKMKMPAEFLEQGLDFISGKVNPKFEKFLSTVSGVRLWNKLLDGLEKAYGNSDPLFKVDHMYTRTKAVIDDLDIVEDGRFINLNTDKQLYQRVYKNSDGTWRLGSIDGRVVSDAQMTKMVAKDAAQSANRLYFDYSDVPRGLEILRAAGLDGLILNPFVTWSWKALYLPTIKDGLAKEIMTGGRMVETDSPALNRKMNRNIMAREMTRMMVMNTATAASRNENMSTPDILKTVLQYGSSPWLGSVVFGDLDSWVTSRAGIDGSGSTTAFFGGLRSFFRDVPAEMNRNTMDWEDNAEIVTDALDERTIKSEEAIEAAFKIEDPDAQYFSQMKAEEKAAVLGKASDIWDELTENNPDGHKKFVYEIRSAHPMYDYNAMETIGKMLLMDKPMLQSFVEFTGNDKVKAQDAYSGMAMGALIGSKGMSRLGEDGLRVARGESDPDLLKRAFGTRKVPHAYFLRKQKYLVNSQEKRWAVENGYVRNEKDNEETRLKKDAWRILGRMVSLTDGEEMSHKLADMLRSKGVDVLDIPYKKWNVRETTRPEIVRPLSN